MGTRAGKSVSLDMKIWEAIEEYRSKNELRNTSVALEEIVRVLLKVKLNGK